MIKRKGYLCGPTVYDSQHIGNYKTFFKSIEDFRNQKKRNAILMMNITDISDKIYVNSSLEHEAILKYTNRYIREFVQIMKTLGLKPWALDLRRSSFEMKNIKKDIKKLMKELPSCVKILEDGVVFYPKMNEEKKFYIWRVSPEIGVFESRDLDPTLEKGIPGWHNECASLIKRYVDKEFVHYGGADLKPIHHHNEEVLLKLHLDYKINYKHSGTLKYNNQKISKSRKNIPIDICEILKNPSLKDAYIAYFRKVSFKAPSEYDNSIFIKERLLKPNLRKRTPLTGLILRRNNTRKNKDYTNADLLRSKIEKNKYYLRDLNSKETYYYYK